MIRILFVHNHPSQFVKIDRELLGAQFAVTDWFERDFLKLRPLRIRRQVAAHDVVFCWFASWHSYFPVRFARRMGKPSIVVVGGYDTANVPRAGYGSQRGGPRKWLSRAILRGAARLMATSESARQEAIVNAAADPAKVSVAYLGVAPVPSGPLTGRERLVLNVGNVWQENLLRKGILPFVQAAAQLPDVRFVHAGRWCDRSIEALRQAAGPNVEFRGFVGDDELADLFARASVYVQPSLHEGFGLSVAEAMSAGCIPVVSRAGSLPEVVGDTGVFMETTDPRDIATAIKQAFTRDGEQRRRTRSRVLDHFSLEQRRRNLVAAVETTLAVHA